MKTNENINRFRPRIPSENGTIELEELQNEEHTDKDRLRDKLRELKEMLGPELYEVGEKCLRNDPKQRAKLDELYIILSQGL